MAFTVHGGEVYLEGGNPRIQVIRRSEKSNEKLDEFREAEHISTSLWQKIKRHFIKTDAHFERFFKREIQTIIWKSSEKISKDEKSKYKNSLEYVRDLLNYIGNVVGSSLWVLIKNLMKPFYAIGMGIYHILKALFWTWQHGKLIDEAELLVGRNKLQRAYWVVQWLTTVNGDVEQQLKKRGWSPQQKDAFVVWAHNNKIYRRDITINLDDHGISTVNVRTTTDGKYILLSDLKDAIEQHLKVKRGTFSDRVFARTNKYAKEGFEIISHTIRVHDIDTGSKIIAAVNPK